MKKSSIEGYLIALFLFIPLLSMSQQEGGQVYSLEQAQNYAVKNNLSVQNASRDVEIARQKIWETTAIGLPQINGSVQYQNFLDIPTTLLPDFISPSVYGVLLQEGLISPAQMPTDLGSQFFPAKFGTQHNASAGLTLSQLIFSGQYIVGLQASKIFMQMSEQSLRKTEIDIRNSVSETYILALSLTETKAILDSSLIKFKKLLYETEAMYAQGFVEETNVDQLKLNVSNLENSVSALSRQIEMVLNLLKFQMGIDLGQSIILSDNLESVLTSVNLEYFMTAKLEVEKNNDYKIVSTSVELQRLNLKRERSMYLPSIAAYLSASEKAMRDEFNFFSGEEDWYPTTIVGINLDIPIWSSGSRHSKTQQAKLNVEKAQANLELVEQSLQLQFEQAKIKYLSALDKLRHEQQNVALASKILDKTMIKFKEGLASSMELTQAQMQHLTAQSNYFAAVLEVMSAKNQLEKLITE